jgi:hypothetical protein
MVLAWDIRRLMKASPLLPQAPKRLARNCRHTDHCFPLYPGKGVNYLVRGVHTPTDPFTVQIDAQSPHLPQPRLGNEHPEVEKPWLLA